MNEPNRLLQRLDDIGRALARDEDALALLALGSVGRELDRLDTYSDLDFFVIVRSAAKDRFLSDHTWLEEAAPIIFRHRGTRDGLHILYADGIYCEMAVFTVEEMGRAHYTPGRLVWKRSWIADSLAVPGTMPSAPVGPTVEKLLGEIQCNLYVGLLRHRRGERLAAAREIQHYAVDRLLQLAAYMEPAGPAATDPFAPARRFEQRYPQMSAHLPDFQQGYDRTPQSAAAILDFLAERFELNVGMIMAIRALIPAA